MDYSNDDGWGSNNDGSYGNDNERSDGWKLKMICDYGCELH